MVPPCVCGLGAAAFGDFASVRWVFKIMRGIVLSHVVLVPWVVLVVVWGVLSLLCRRCFCHVHLSVAVSAPLLVLFFWGVAHVPPTYCHHVC